jgi:hypothetical protein
MMKRPDSIMGGAKDTAAKGTTAEMEENIKVVIANLGQPVLWDAVG